MANSELQDKFRGCIAATWIGSAMGAAVEGWTPERIRDTHGWVDKLLPYAHYREYTDWQRPPGTTEDGIDRQKLIATAIIEKQGRIDAHDLAAVWIRDVDLDKIVYKQEPFDGSLVALAKAGVPPIEIGRLWPFPNVISMARSSHPIGLINAGDPEAAAEDAFEVGKMFAPETAFALRWAALYQAAIAEAARPGATVESVIEVAKEYSTYRAEAGSLYALYDTISADIDHALKIADTFSDVEEFRAEFYKKYDGGNYFNYHLSQANEIVAKGLAVFVMTNGNAKDSIEIASNFGRDTDCLAAISSGLAGTLHGTRDLPQEWIDQVNAATAADPYTNSEHTIEEFADGLYAAFETKLAGLRRYIDIWA